MKKRGETVGNFECAHNVAPTVAVIVSQRLSRSLTNHRQNSSVTGSHRCKPKRKENQKNHEREEKYWCFDFYMVSLSSTWDDR